jgi:iron complex transport system substrate-binding protein
MAGPGKALDDITGEIVVEVKSVEKTLPVHQRQLLTYLRLMHLRVGLLINFGAPTMREGLRRIVHELPPPASPREPFAGKFDALSRAGHAC